MEKISLKAKLEWALMTLRENLTFGMPEEQAVYRRESRVKGVLLDAVEEVEELEKQIAEANQKTEKVMSDARLEMRLRDAKIGELEGIVKELYKPIQLFWDEDQEISMDQLLQYFSYQHLPPHLQEVSKPFHDLAHEMVKLLPENPERTVGLRKLLEAKDCAVRAKLTKQ